MSKRIQVILFLLVGLLSVGFVSAGTQLNIPSCWVLSSSGLSIDSNCDGIIDFSAYANSVNSSVYYNQSQVNTLLSLKLNITDQRYNDTAYCDAGLSLKLNTSDQRYNDTALITTETNSRVANDSFLQAQINNISINSSSNLDLIQDVNASLNTEISTRNISDVALNNSILALSGNLSANYYNVTYIDLLIANYYNKSEVDFLISNISSLTNYYDKNETNIYYNYTSEIATLRSVESTDNSSLWVNKLNTSDQRYNDTVVISSVNNSLQAQINNLSVNSSSNLQLIIDTNNSLNTLRSVESADNTSLWINKLNTTDQRYNDTLAISNIASGLTNETNARIANDSFIQNQVTLNTNSIQSTNNSLNTLRSIESADNTSLWVNKLNTTDQRYNDTTAISNVASGLTNETNARIANDTVLNNSILTVSSGLTNETNARIANDSALDISLKAYTDSKLITKFYNATSLLVVTGTGSGVIANINAYDNIPYNVTEVGSSIDLRLNYTGINTTVNQIIIRYGTVPAEGHASSVFLWDYDESTWEGYDVLGGDDGSYVVKTTGIFDATSHVSNGTLQLRIYMNATVPAKTDLWRFDWVSVASGPATPSGQETDPLSVHKDGTTPLTGNWNAGSFNITAEEFKGKINASYIQNSYFATQVDNTSLQSQTSNLRASNITTNSRIDTLNTTKLNNAGTNNYDGTLNINGTLNVNETVHINGGFSNGGTSLIGDSIWGSNLYLTGEANITIVNVYNTSVNGTMKPILDDLYDLGTSSYRYRTIYGVSIVSTTINATTFNEGGTALASKYGSIATSNALVNNNITMYNSNASQATELVALRASNATMYASNTSQATELSALRTSNATMYASNASQATELSALRTSNATMYASNASQANELVALRASNTTIFANIASVNTTAVSKAGTGTATCSAGTVAQNVTTTTSGVTSQCIADKDTTYVAGTGLILTSTTFSLNETYTNGLYYTLTNGNSVATNATNAIAIATSAGTNATNVRTDLVNTNNTVNTLVTNNITVQSNIASVNTTAVNALPKAGGTMTGNITIGNYIGWYVNTTVYSMFNGTCWDTRNGATHLYVC